MPWSARPGVPAFVIGGAILGDALTLPWRLQADRGQGFGLGSAISWLCAFRARFGLPCPSCGLTRSVVMSLHGEFAAAWRMAPAGPVVVVGMIAFAFALLALAWLQGASAPGWEAYVRAWIRKSAAIYAMGV